MPRKKAKSAELISPPDATEGQDIEGAQPLSPCRHHWVIQPADGPVSPGVCQLCGEAREFKNFVESEPWGNAKLRNEDFD